MIKNAVITHEQTIDYPSPTVPGPADDVTLEKPMAQTDWPNWSMLVIKTQYQDLPLPPAPVPIQPYKKKKKRKLSSSHHSWNRLVAKVMVLVAHMFAEV